MMRLAEGKPAAPPEMKPVPAVVRSNVEFVNEAALPQIWRDVLEGFKRSQPMLHGLLASSRLGPVSEGQATLLLGSDHHTFARTLEKDGRREKVAAALSEALGQSVGVRIVVEADAAVPAAPKPVIEPRRIVKPTIEQATAMLAAESDRQLAGAARAQPGMTGNAVPASPGALRLTDELKAELLQDELVRALAEGLGAQIVKVSQD